MIRGIEHTAIATPDPAALAQWYVDTLGFVINYRGSTAVFVKAPNGSMIEFIPAEGDRGPNTLKSPGLRHLALIVDDFEAQYARLQRKGRALHRRAEREQGQQGCLLHRSRGQHPASAPAGHAAALKQAVGNGAGPGVGRPRVSPGEEQRRVRPCRSRKGG
jgi:glyoxylase I family protein